MKAAVRRGLIRDNPVAHVDPLPVGRRKWRILSPAEIRGVEQAFDEMIEEAEEGSEQRAWRHVARTTFLVTHGLGLRRAEILGLRWRHVRLTDPEGAWLRVEETLVRGKIDTPKSERSERTIALGPRVADELFEHRARSAYQGDDERVFMSPHRGTPLNPKRYADTFREALAKAEIGGYVRPFHDGRHSQITNAAAAGTNPAALMARSGHSDFKTTQLYIDLAGETFRPEAELLEARLWGASATPSGTKGGYKVGDPSPPQETENPA
jgi:integrase